MQYEEFINQVGQRAGLASAAEAEGAARAVLTVLGEYLSGGEGPALASQLPQGLAEILRQQPPDRSKIFSLNDFVQMVGEKEDVDDGAAIDHIRAVFGVLQEAVSGGEMDDVRRQFPSEFDPLFELQGGEA